MILEVFNDPGLPFLGSQSRLMPPQGINNDRSLMRFAIILQHAYMAYHVQRAERGRPFDFWGGGRRRVWVISENNILKTDLEQILQGNTWHTIALYVREEILSPEVWGKKILTPRKSYYRLILRLRHQSLIVHSRSKVVHVYSLLHDEWITAGRLGTF